MTWIVIRAAGVAAYVLLFASVAWGLVGTSGLLGKKVTRATAIAVHRYLSTVAIVLLVAHLGGLLLDRFLPFGVADLLVPLRAPYRPAATALGIVAMYGLGVIAVSSGLKKHIGVRWWRKLHTLAAPVFALSMLHGVLAGTDTAKPWMWPLYLGTGLTVTFLLIFRALTARSTSVARPAVRPDTSSRPATKGRVVPGRTALPETGPST